MSASEPARAGDVLLVYANGLGPVTPDAATGLPAPPDALRRTVFPYRAVFQSGGVRQEVEVAFAGLAPGFVGVFQVNAAVPAGLPPGEATMTLRTTAGDPSNEVRIAIQ